MSKTEKIYRVTQVSKRGATRQIVEQNPAYEPMIGETVIVEGAWGIYREEWTTTAYEEIGDYIYPN